MIIEVIAERVLGPRCYTCGTRIRADFCGRCLARRVMADQANEPSRRIYRFNGEPSHHWRDALAER